jgi:putative transposase
MKKGRFSDEQKIDAVRQMDGGRPAAEIGRELGVSKHAVYAWKLKYGGMELNDARRLKQLEDENRRLKVVVADLTLDRDILRAVIAKNGWSS